MLPLSPRSTLFPYTTLFRSKIVIIENQLEKSNHDHLGKLITYLSAVGADCAIWIVSEPRSEHVKAVDRKSTRLNSSHVAISYAVFCLKKKRRININTLISYS